MNNVQKIFLGVLVTGLLGFLIPAGLYWRNLEDFASSPGPNHKTLELYIEPGTNARQVANLLEKSGAITSARSFYHYLRYLSGNVGQLKAGDYEFAAGQTPQQIIDILSSGRTVQVRLTIPEGSNKKDIAAIIERAGFGKKEEILALMESSELLARLHVPRVPGGLEGYLFPDTYQIAKRTPPAAILERMRARLKEVMTSELEQRLQESPLDLNQVLTLASIVEKETGDPAERPEIAGVFLNRLALKMKLQTDPTVIYSVPNYSGNLRKADLQIDNPYNTYVYAGLPPGPIASPGLAAIKAVLWPAQTRNLYFVSRNDGTHEFCPTLACHSKAVKYWQIDYFKEKKKYAMLSDAVN
jgi:UPF0755 protein